MILHYFKRKENKDKQLAQNFYKKILYSSNSILNKNSFFKESNYNTSFEIVSIILIIYIKLNIKFNIKNHKNVNEYLINNFVLDLDDSLRSKGIGDMSIGKYVKSYIKKFYFRLSKFPYETDKIDENYFLNYLQNFEYISSKRQIEASKVFLEIFNDIKASYTTK
tara:strand:- start:2233 stop:2727 length:495 start_codon:yes stop_codon:yes gene_type:complete